jgi:hypothetical protein
MLAPLGRWRVLQLLRNHIRNSSMHIHARAGGDHGVSQGNSLVCVVSGCSWRFKDCSNLQKRT